MRESAALEGIMQILQIMFVHTLIGQHFYFYIAC